MTLNLCLILECLPSIAATGLQDHYYTISLWEAEIKTEGDDDVVSGSDGDDDDDNNSDRMLTFDLHEPD